MSTFSALKCSSTHLASSVMGLLYLSCCIVGVIFLFFLSRYTYRDKKNKFQIIDKKLILYIRFLMLNFKCIYTFKIEKKNKLHIHNISIEKFAVTHNNPKCARILNNPIGCSDSNIKFRHNFIDEVF